MTQSIQHFEAGRIVDTTTLRRLADLFGIVYSADISDPHVQHFEHIKVNPHPVQSILPSLVGKVLRCRRREVDTLNLRSTTFREGFVGSNITAIQNKSDGMYLQLSGKQLYRPGAFDAVTESPIDREAREILVDLSNTERFIGISVFPDTVTINDLLNISDRENILSEGAHTKWALPISCATFSCGYPIYAADLQRLDSILETLESDSAHTGNI